MATIDDFGGLNDPLNHPPLGGPNGWAAAVRDRLTKAAVQERTPNPATGDSGLPGYVGSDTGWRSLINPAVAEEVGVSKWRTGVNGLNRSSLMVRRVGQQVFWTLWEMYPPAGSTDFWATTQPRHGGIVEVPNGFRQTSHSGWPAMTGVGAWNAHNYMSGMYMAGMCGFLGNAQMDGWSTQYVLGVLHRGDPRVDSTYHLSAEFSYVTANTWPTSLPGTQYTAPANWT